MDSGLSLKFHGQVVVGGQLYSSVSLSSHGLCFGDFWNFSGTLGDWDLGLTIAKTPFVRQVQVLVVRKH